MSIFDRLLGGQDRNESQEPEKHEGISSSLLPELELDKPDEEILEAIKAFQKDWEPYDVILKNKRRKNELSWKNKLSEAGLSEDTDDFWNDNSSDNVIFESLETYLSNATKTHPEPVVSSPNVNESIVKFGKHVKDLLIFDIDRDKLKLKVKKSARFLELYYIGPVKLEFDVEENRIRSHAIRPHDLMLEKNSEIEGGWYTGDMLAQRKEDSASKMVDMFPKKKKFITSKANKKMQTKLGYLEVWTKEYRVFKMDDEILKKEKNPHFNYSKSVPTSVDEEGEVIREDREPLNHFVKPRIPYLFLSVHNLGLHPFDDTTLFEQALPYQRTIAKRNKQIDENVDGMNGGWIGDNKYFEEDTLQEAVQAIRDGDAVLAPQGSLTKESGNALDGAVYNDLADRRQRLKEMFGVIGLQPSGLKGEDTVRGKILAKGADGDRISGGINEFIEQQYDAILNYWVQMMYVYYTTDDLTRILGEKSAAEFMGLQEFMVNKELSVSIKEGSLIPKDDLTKRNEAIDLWSANALDLISLFKALDHSNPQEAAYAVWLFQNNPQQYFAEFGGRQVEEQIQALAAPQGQPGVPGAEPQGLPPVAQPAQPPPTSTSLLANAPV